MAHAMFSFFNVKEVVGSNEGSGSQLR